MKKLTLIIIITFSGLCNAQTLIQSVNSGSIIGTSSSVSVGEIVVDSVNPLQAGSGLIGILSQQTLEVAEFEFVQGIIAYPNPTISGIYFKSTTSLNNEKVTVFNSNGQLVIEKTINSDNSVDLSQLASGIYVIQLASDKSKTFKIIKH
ncbi:MAG: T9SS type A sorting domain-containing protein [Bacteroidota bacterium]